MNTKTYASKGYNLLIAPTLDANLSDHLASVAGEEVARLRKKDSFLEFGDTVNTYGIGNISGSTPVFVVRSIFSVAANEVFGTSFAKRDLSLKAKVPGNYTTQALFGAHYGDDYNPEAHNATNPIATTYADATELRGSCSYFAFTPSSRSITGEEVFSDFF